MLNYTVSYAQNAEDVIIEAFFPDLKEGFYIDVGANHPFYHSVTKRFYDKGWSGINFEPNPMLFKQIQEQRSRDINLMQGVGDKKGSFKLRVYHSKDGLEGISTLSPEMQRDYSKYPNEDVKDFSDVNIEVTTLSAVLSELKPSKIHFMKVDVEGFEYEVLKGNDWKKFRPELICIEANHVMNDWRPILAQTGYSLVFNDGLNDYYLAKEAKGREKNFDYAKIFLSSDPVLPFEVSEKIRSLTEQKKAAEKTILDLESTKTKLEKENQTQRETIEEIGSLAKHAKRAVKNRLHVNKEKEN